MRGRNKKVWSGGASWIRRSDLLAISTAAAPTTVATNGHTLKESVLLTNANRTSHN